MPSTFLKALNSLMDFDKKNMEKVSKSKATAKPVAGAKLKRPLPPEGMQSLSFEKKVTRDCKGKEHTERKAKICLEGEKCFWVKDGKVLKSIDDLLEAFQDMSDDVFGHHTSGGKNDFANWLRFCLMDTETADNILKAKNVPEAKDIILRAVEKYY